MRLAHVLAFVFLSVGSAGAQTLPVSSQAKLYDGEAKPLAAWTEFCEREPAKCAVRLSEPATIKLDRVTFRLLEAINQSVNASIQPVTDQDHWRLTDQWDIPYDGKGDCEDYQLLKREILVGLGLPRRAMRMTVVVDGNNQGHAVLTVRTDRGDFILDNQDNRVLPWTETGYYFVKRESSDFVGWVGIQAVQIAAK